MVMHTTVLAFALLFTVQACCVYALQAEEAPRPPGPEASGKDSENARKAELARTLIQQLASEEFQARETAAAELVKLGQEILPDIEQAEKKIQDPEALLRLACVRTELRFAAATTLEKAMELWKNFVEEALAASPNLERVISRLELADRAMLWIGKIAPNEKISEENRCKLLGDLYYEYGMKLYGNFCSKKHGLEKSAVQAHLNKYFDAASSCFSKYLDKNPADKATAAKNGALSMYPLDFTW